MSEQVYKCKNAKLKESIGLNDFHNYGRFTILENALKVKHYTDGQSNHIIDGREASWDGG